MGVAPVPKNGARHEARLVFRKSRLQTRRTEKKHKPMACLGFCACDDRNPHHTKRMKRIKRKIEGSTRLYYIETWPGEVTTVCVVKADSTGKYNPRPFWGINVHMPTIERDDFAKILKDIRKGDRE